MLPGAVPISAPSGRPARPASLDVKASAAFPLRNITADAGIGISTPSSGLFNFDSLMDGGTGLTPVAAPISLQSNRGPLDLITPTSTEPSKLCSLWERRNVEEQEEEEEKKQLVLTFLRECTRDERDRESPSPRSKMALWF